MPNIRMTPFPGQQQPNLLQQILQQLGLRAANVINPQMRQQVQQAQNPFNTQLKPPQTTLPITPMPPAQARNPFTPLKDFFNPAYAPTQEQMNKFFPRPVNEQTALGLPSIIPLQDYAQTVLKSKELKAESEQEKIKDYAKLQNEKSNAMMQYMKESGVDPFRMQAYITSVQNRKDMTEQQKMDAFVKASDLFKMPEDTKNIWKDLLIRKGWTDDELAMYGFPKETQLMVTGTKVLPQEVTTVPTTAGKKVMPVMEGMPEIFDTHEAARQFLLKNKYGSMEHAIIPVATITGKKWYVRPQKALMTPATWENKYLKADDEIRRFYIDLELQKGRDLVNASRVARLGGGTGGGKGGKKGGGGGGGEYSEASINDKIAAIKGQMTQQDKTLSLTKGGFGGIGGDQKTYQEAKKTRDELNSELSQWYQLKSVYGGKKKFKSQTPMPTPKPISVQAPQKTKSYTGKTGKTYYLPNRKP